MAILSSMTHELPKRKARPKWNPWDQQPDYQALKAAVAGGRMKPKEQKAMTVHAAEMGEKLGLKDPVRAASDGMRRWLRSMKLNHDYWSEKFETETPGVFALIVTYDPAMGAMRPQATGARKPRADKGRSRPFQPPHNDPTRSDGA